MKEKVAVSAAAARSETVRRSWSMIIVTESVNWRMNCAGGRRRKGREEWSGSALRSAHTELAMRAGATLDLSRPPAAREPRTKACSRSRRRCHATAPPVAAVIRIRKTSVTRRTFTARGCAVGDRACLRGGTCSRDGTCMSERLRSRAARSGARRGGVRPPLAAAGTSRRSSLRESGRG